jgi:hypothetical protein
MDDLRPELMKVVKQFRYGVLTPNEAVEVAQKHHNPNEVELDRLKELVGWQQDSST